MGLIVMFVISSISLNADHGSVNSLRMLCNLYRIPTLFIAFFTMATCSSRVDRHQSKQKNVSNTIDREAKFIKSRISVEVSPENYVFISVEISNSSTEAFQFGKSSLPNSGNPVFGIFSSNNLKEVPFVGNSNWDDYDEIRTTEVDSTKFVTLKAGDTLRFKVNISQLYEFPKNEPDTYFISYSVGMPFVKNNKLMTEEQFDGDKKPIHYFVFSNRVKFSLQ